MAAPLPYRSFDEFYRRLTDASPVHVTEAVARRLHSHYEELRRWSPSLSLIGPGTVGDAVERHYGESLAGAPLIPDGARTLVDVGSGAGFPGFVLAALRDDLDVVLVEPRERRWAFLQAAARRASLPLRCLDARVGSPLPRGLPERIDVVTVRALKIPAPGLAALVDRFAPTSVLLSWTGADEPESGGLLRPGRELATPGAEQRRIVELVPLPHATEP